MLRPIHLSVRWQLPDGSFEEPLSVARLISLWLDPAANHRTAGERPRRGSLRRELQRRDQHVDPVVINGNRMD